MDLQHLRTFAEVVRLGSFAAAARRLDMAPSMVTRSVATLEDTLGARLLHRTTRRLSLTEAGSAYFERIGPVLQELDDAADAVREREGVVTGTVRVTASVAYGQAALVPLLPRLHALHPQLQLDLLLTDAVVDLVSQRVDVALRLGPALDSSMVGLKLAPVRYRVCASPAWVSAHGRPASPTDLSDTPCLRFPLPGYRTLWSFRPSGTAREGADTVQVHVSGWLVASSAFALRQAALDGLGPALLADWMVHEEIAAGRLIDLFPDHEASARDFDTAVWLLYASREHLPKRVRAVVDFLRDALRGP